MIGGETKSLSRTLVTVSGQAGASCILVVAAAAIGVIRKVTLFEEIDLLPAQHRADIVDRVDHVVADAVAARIGVAQVDDERVAVARGERLAGPAVERRGHHRIRSAEAVAGDGAAANSASACRKAPSGSRGRDS